MKAGRRARNIALGIWLPALLLAGWQALVHSGVLHPLIFPAPSALLGAARDMIASGELPSQIRATLLRLSAGFVAGSAAGLLCGLLMGGMRKVRLSLEPLIAAIYSTPKLTLLPMLMLIFGIGPTAGMLLVATASFIQCTIHSLDAIRNLDRSYVELAVNYGADTRAVFRKVYFPACLPQVFTGLRLALGQSLIMTISTEMLSPSSGLGSMIWMAWQTFATEKLYVAVLTASLLGILFHRLLRWLEGRLIPWRPVHAKS